MWKREYIFLNFDRQWNEKNIYRLNTSLFGHEYMHFLFNSHPIGSRDILCSRSSGGRGAEFPSLWKNTSDIFPCLSILCWCFASFLCCLELLNTFLQIKIERRSPQFYSTFIQSNLSKATSRFVKSRWSLIGIFKKNIILNNLTHEIKEYSSQLFWSNQCFWWFKCFPMRVAWVLEEMNISRFLHPSVNAILAYEPFLFSQAIPVHTVLSRLFLKRTNW